MYYEITWKNVEGDARFLQGNIKAPPRKREDKVDAFVERCKDRIFSFHGPQVKKTGEVRIEFYAFELYFA